MVEEELDHILLIADMGAIYAPEWAEREVFEEFRNAKFALHQVLTPSLMGGTEPAP
jgi:hypothetical protein